MFLNPLRQSKYLAKIKKISIIFEKEWIELKFYDINEL